MDLKTELNGFLHGFAQNGKVTLEQKIFIHLELWYRFVNIHKVYTHIHTHLYALFNIPVQNVTRSVDNYRTVNFDSFINSGNQIPELQYANDTILHFRQY